MTANPTGYRTTILHLGLTTLFLLLMGGPAGAQQPANAANPPRIPTTPGQNPNGMRVFIWAGLKSHGPGQHDYPQFLADWSKL